jgi:UTP:GlnB (protein PII) uridylyltransferase
MVRSGKLILVALVVIVVCFGLGYGWGASGRVTLQRALEETREQLDLAEARGHLLDARVSLYNMNFGDASRRLEDVKVLLRRTHERYSEKDRDEAARSIAAALEYVDEAQRLANKLDQAANTKTGEALEAIRVATSR